MEAAFSMRLPLWTTGCGGTGEQVIFAMGLLAVQPEKLADVHRGHRTNRQQIYIKKQVFLKGTASDHRTAGPGRVRFKLRPA
jgi:hypothetical protein